MLLLPAREELLMRRLIICLSLCLLWAPVVRAQPSSAETSAKIDALLAEYGKSGSPGCAVVVVQDGKVVHKRGYGQASIEHNIAIDPETTVFNVGSVSKHFTVFAVLKLAREGKLNLDDPIHKYIPEAGDTGKRVTVRQLIHHTSGLRDYFVLLGMSGTRILEDVVTTEDILGLLARQKDLNFEPGTQFVYCNSSYELLGVLVEKVSKQPLRDYLHDQVFEPLGMKATQVRSDHRSIVRNLATPYARRGDGFRLSPIAHHSAGATNVYTTAADLVLWDENFTTAKVGGRPLLDDLHRRGTFKDGTEISYAGGLFIDEYRGLKTVSHGGSHGGYRAFFLRFPEQRCTIIVLSNLADFDPFFKAHQVADVCLAARLGPAPKTPADLKIDGKLLENYAGEYHLPIGVANRLSVADGTLILHSPRRHKLEPLSESEFYDPSNCSRWTFRRPGPNAPVEATWRTGPWVFKGVNMQRVQADVAAFKDYVGQYHSDELDTTLSVEVRGEQLCLRLKKGDLELVAWQPDEFFTRPVSASDPIPPFAGAVRFVRAPGKEVTALTLNVLRTQNVRFSRVEAKP
jgi:CubicO group peptidase (beta-lactamase class C family)